MHHDYAQSYSELYRKHWWWRARERILVRTLKEVPLPTPARILDVGCGDGLFFAKLREFGSVQGIETDSALIRAENPDRHAIHTQPLGDPKYAGLSFDLITALDVVEHLSDDQAAVTHMVSMLKPGGHLLLTVPAFMSLWDEHDVANHHMRRYTADMLKQLVHAPARLVDVRYMFHAIFLPKYLIGLLNRVAPRKLKQSTIPAQPLNRLMTTYCDWEDRLLKPAHVPFGTSVLALVRRAS